MPAIIILSASYIYAIVICSTLAVLFFAIPYVLSKKDKLQKYNTVVRYSQSLWMCVVGILLLTHAHWLSGINGILWSIVFAFLAKVEQCIFKQQQIMINAKEVSYSNILFSTTLAWGTIEKIVARNDYISIFKKNNHYLQFEITDDLSDAQLKEINELCTKLIIDNK